MAVTFGKIVKRLSGYIKDRDTRKFISHNLNVFAPLPGCAIGGPEVLFELNTVSVSHVAYSYFAGALAKKHGATIRAYTTDSSPTLLRRLDWKLSQAFSSGEFGVFKSFGTSGFVQPNLPALQQSQTKKIANEIIENLTSKTEIEEIKMDGILLGDLIYDSFMREFSKPTIELADPDFKCYLFEAIRAYVFWKNYFDTHNVKAVNVSHCAYVMAIPLRIALDRGIDAYQINATHAYKMSAERPFAYTDFFDFRKNFSELSVQRQIEGKAIAKERIEQRFAGEVGVDMHYSTKSAYGVFKNERLLKESSRTKILVAPHCFFDSPHGFGMNLFPDFYEWFDFLGKITEVTDYDWYIKTHPDYLPGNSDIIDSFIAKYSKFTLLPADASHHQLIDEGVDFALTCYGTIGFEYAALGVPVINASLNNPHIAYDFNVHPQNIIEYEKLLMNLDIFEIDIKIEDVYEFYYMNRIYNTVNWLYKDYNGMEEKIGGRLQLLTPIVYRAWMNEWSRARHDTTRQSIDNFVKSGDYRLSEKHMTVAS